MVTTAMHLVVVKTPRLRCDSPDIGYGVTPSAAAGSWA
jgi:hypothetical protein